MQYIGEEDFRERVFGMELKIRAVSEADAEELVEIYRYYVEHTAITYESVSYTHLTGIFRTDSGGRTYVGNHL